MGSICWLIRMSSRGTPGRAGRLGGFGAGSWDMSRWILRSEWLLRRLLSLFSFFTFFMLLHACNHFPHPSLGSTSTLSPACHHAARGVSPTLGGFAVFFLLFFGRPGRLVSCGWFFLSFLFSDSPVGGFGNSQSDKKITRFEGMDACVRWSFVIYFFYFRLGG